MRERAAQPRNRTILFVRGRNIKIYIKTYIVIVKKIIKKIQF